jgi:FtsP/CotA-like multicopper oxidase with cupredoxin domain
MYYLVKLWCLFLAPILQAHGATIPASDLTTKQSCTHGPTSRNCWSNGFDIDTDVYQSWPSTGQSITYDLRITNATCNPDGHGEKWCQLINGQYPGPTIRANWGDTVRIVVHNDLQNNGTSIHWHGVRQLNTCQQDGTNGVTECPIAPGMTKTYQWKATQYGTTWYHSHHTAQYGEGVVGTIIIDGPATANYDEDLGVLPLTDWYYGQVFTLLWSALYGGRGPPSSQNVLVNGNMVDGAGNGHYTKLRVQKGKKYRLRLVNTAVDHLFHVSMDGHPLTVISADFVPVKPYNTTDLKIAIGQRYDIVFTADKDVGNYWLRVQPGSGACGRAQIYGNSAVTVGAIIGYEGADDALPTSSASTMAATCEDEIYEPWKTLPVPSATFSSQLETLAITSGHGAQNIVNWFINTHTMDVDWEKPTLDYVRDGNTSYTQTMNVVEMPQADQWYFWVIQNTNAPGLPHPIHLHGHDFWILGSGSGTFSGTAEGLNFAAPMRRDVATLPASGWLVLAFPSDNPGSWLMHCHIAWHASSGLAMQFLERRDEIVGRIGSLADMDQGCIEWSRDWNSPARLGVDEDSGLRRPAPPYQFSGPGSGV